MELQVSPSSNTTPKIIARPHGYFRGAEYEDCAPAVKSSAYAANNPIVEQYVLGWSRDEHGNVIDRHPVDVANCVTSAKRDNTQNYVQEKSIAAMRGRSDGEGNTAQRLEVGTTDTSNALTSVAKDNLLLEECQVLTLKRTEEAKEQTLLNGDGEGNASTITTGHHFSGNITNPKGGHKEMGGYGAREYESENTQTHRARIVSPYGRGRTRY